jgi:hypothetical protein
LLVTVVVLVALPILLIFSNLIGSLYSDEIITFSRRNFGIPDLGIQLINSIQYVIFAVMLILYPIYPSLFSVEKHLGKRNPKSTVTEYHILKKIVYVLLPFFFFALALILSSIIVKGDNPLLKIVASLGNPVLILLVVSTLGAILFVVGSALLRIILLNRSKDFKFYFARQSFRTVSRGEDDVERMKYLIVGLSSYNKYIRRSLGLQINDLKVIYSKIIADPAIDKNYSIKQLCEAFEDDDKLKSITCLTGLLNVKDPEHFLVKQSLGKKIEDWGSILGTLASTIAALIGAVATLPIPGLP